MEASRERSVGGVSRASSRERAIAQWKTVLQWIQEQGEPWTTMPAARVAEWLDPVGRYTFNLTRSATDRPTSPAASADGQKVRRSNAVG